MSDPNNQDEFEDDDLEPVWASPDDAEDDWDDGFSDGEDLSDEDDGFDASADADPFEDDEYDSEFDEGEATAQAASDEFGTDDDFDEDFDAYEDGEEGFGEDDDYEDDDEYADEDGAGDPLAAGDQANRSPVQKLLPYAMMGGFGLIVLYVGYTMVLGGGGGAPAPSQQLPLTPPPAQTAQNNTGGNSNTPPLALPGQGNVPNAQDQGIPGFPGSLGQTQAGLSGITPPNPVTVTPQTLDQLPGVDAIGQAVPSNLGQIPNSGGLGNLSNSQAVQAMNNAPSVLAELGNIGVAQPLGSNTNNAGASLPPAANLPQQQGLGLSGSLGLSTGNGNPRPMSAEPVNPPSQTQAASNAPLPTSLSQNPGITSEDLQAVVGEIRGDLAQEIKSGMADLRNDLRDSMQNVFEEEMVLIQGQINGLERRIEELATAQRNIVAAPAPSQPVQQPVPPPQPVQTRQNAEDGPMVDNQSDADPEMTLEQQMAQAIAAVETTDRPQMTASVDTAPVATSRPSPSTRSVSPPPTIRVSAAPKVAPPVPAQKPGSFMAQGLAPQPGPFGAQLPVQMADMRGQPNGLYQLRGVSSGTAWVSAQDTGTVLTINRGDFLPGLGRVTEIRRSFNGWEVVAERGIIRQ